MNDRFDELVDLIPEWLVMTRGTKVFTGLSREDAIRRAEALREAIRGGRALPAEDVVLNDDSKEVLHALVFLLGSSANDAESRFVEAGKTYSFLRSVEWGDDLLGEKERLLRDCTEIARRAAGCDAPGGAGAGDQEWFASGAFSAEIMSSKEALAVARVYFETSLPEHSAKFAAECLLAVPIGERGGKAQESYLDDPDAIVPLLGILRGKLDTSPSLVRDEAEYFYRFLEKEVPGLPDELFLFDERNYFLGDAARLAGIACRVLSRREEARRWFDLSENWFLRTIDPAKNLSQLSYQRLALLTEERRFEEVLRVLPQLIAAFKSFGMAEDALKCRFLEGLAYWEMGQAERAISVYREICAQAEAIRSVRLIAEAANNLVHFYSSMGEVEEALSYSRKALPMLKQLENRVGLAKLQWSIGDLLRGQGKLGEAAHAYRSALEEAREVGMRGDVAALHLVLADVLLDANLDRQAEWEVRAALPIIDEERMVPEGFAAMGFLREALRYRQVDRKALRELHGFFRDRES